MQVGALPDDGRQLTRPPCARSARGGFQTGLDPKPGSDVVAATRLVDSPARLVEADDFLAHVGLGDQGGGLAGGFESCFFAQDGVQDPNPVSDSALFRLTQSALPIDVTEQGASGPRLCETGMDFESGDDIVGERRCDFDKAFQTSRSSERLTHRKPRDSSEQC